MSKIQNSLHEQCFRVIHPLDDAPEQKCQSTGLGLIEMSAGVRLSLRVLRGYLLVMCAMLIYRVLILAGTIPVLR